MAVQMDTFSIVEVAKPNLGEFKPSKVANPLLIGKGVSNLRVYLLQVRADISFDTSLLRANIKTEWDNLRRHDVLFLVAIQGESIAIYCYRSFRNLLSF
jgi:intron-binding protein aquarius